MWTQGPGKVTAMGDLGGFATRRVVGEPVRARHDPSVDHGGSYASRSQRGTVPAPSSLPINPVLGQLQMLGTSFEGEPAVLLTVLATLTDPRERRGVRHQTVAAPASPRLILPVGPVRTGRLPTDAQRRQRRVDHE